MLINPARNPSIFRRRFPIRLWYPSQHLFRQNPLPRSQFGSRRRFPRAASQRQTVVRLACRGQRRRGPGHPRSTTARPQGGAQADGHLEKFLSGAHSFGIRTASLMPSAAAALKRRPLRSKTLCFWKRGMSGHDQRSVRSTLNRCRHRALLSSRKLVLNIFLKLSEQTFNFDNLSFHLRERGLRRFADPHLLSKQAFQLGQLPLKGVDHIDCCLCHACGPAACAQHMLMWDRMREEMRQCRRRLPQSTDTPPTQDRHRRPKCRWDALWPDGPALPRAPPAPAPGAGPGHFKFAVSMTGSAGPDPVLT